MSHKELDLALLKCPLFRNMSKAETQEIIGLLEVEKHQAHENVLREGHNTRCMGIILSGKCQVLKSRVGGDGDHVLSTLEPHSVFGEMSFFDPAPHSATIRALTDVEVALLPRERFDMLLRVGSSAAYKLALNSIEILTERLRKMDAWVCDLVEKTGTTTYHEEWRDFQSKLYAGWKF